jgi:hypothetical protein
MRRRGMECVAGEFARVFLTTLLCFGLSVSAYGKNFALLIGNSNYSIGQLDNPANDAKDLGNVLRSIGFETTTMTDADAASMAAAIREFGERLKNNDGIGLFYYAGHGVQVNGENYLLPVGYPFRNEQEVEKVGVQANTLLRYMEDSKNRVNIVILDACRNNPFIKTRSLKMRGLAPMDAPSGSLVAFSTAPGTEASDGSGKNGLYTKYLMSNLKIPGLTIEQVFKRTREGVESESEQDLGRKQSPREESSLKGGDMYFVPPVSKASPEATGDQVELAYWNSIANSTSPEDYSAYLSQYPQGKFADLARNRVKALKSPPLANRADARSVADESTVPHKPAAVRSGKVITSAKNFSFNDDDDAPVRSAEFISISCRDFIRNKRVRVQIDDRNIGLRRALEQRMGDIGVRLADAGSTSDLIVKGVVEMAGGVNPVVGLKEVEVSGDFSLQSPSGRTLATTSASGSAFSGQDMKKAARGVWEEKSDEVLGKLFKGYCAGR